MPANTSPIFVLTPNISSVLVTAANTSSQGGGTVATDIFKAYTAGTNGSRVDRIRIIPTATTPTTTTATVGRIFISSITSGATTSANTFLIKEYTLSALAADNATTATNEFIWIPAGVAGLILPPSYTILVTNHAAPAANTAWRFTVEGMDF